MSTPWPANERIFGGDVDDVVGLLEHQGLDVNVAFVGCSESTSVDTVRQVTIGDVLNRNIVYGKSTDTTIGPVALRPGASVTVWTPRRNGC